MGELKQVLHKPIPPANDERWHIIIQGQSDELLAALEVVAKHEQHVIKTAEWVEDDELVICLDWIDKVIARQVGHEIQNVSFWIEIIENGRCACHGHNLPI